MAITLLHPIEIGTRGLNAKAVKVIRDNQDIYNHRIVPELNERISRYHQASSDKDKLDCLKQLWQHYQFISQLLSDKVISLSQDYRDDVLDTFVSEVQTELQALGITSMRFGEDGDFQTTITDPESPAEIIENMPPKRAKAFAQTLDYIHNQIRRGKSYEPADIKASLQLIYRDDDFYKDAFNRFLDTYTIRFLGGGNSLNFILTHKTTREISVLKLDNRMGKPMQYEAHLRQHGLSHVFTPIYADRQITYRAVNGSFETRRLRVTDFCAGDDLDKNAKNSPTDSHQRINAALGIYTQMADVLEKITAAGCCFPDMKNANWLLDKNGILKIADTKSFIGLNADGTADLSNGFIHTQFMRAPEMDYPPFSGDKLQVYLLGKNLYQFLAQYSQLDFYVDRYNSRSPVKPDSSLPFDNAVFKTQKGQVLEQLIKQMMQPDPAQRPSMLEVNYRLKQLFKSDLAKTYPEFVAEAAKMKFGLKKIAALGFGKQDTQMNIFLEKMKKRIDNVTTQADIGSIKEEMERIYEMLNEHREEIDAIKLVANNQPDPDKTVYQDEILKAAGEILLEDRSQFKTKSDANKKLAALYIAGKNRIKEKSIDVSKVFKREVKPMAREDAPPKFEKKQ